MLNPHATPVHQHDHATQQSRQSKATSTLTTSNRQQHPPIWHTKRKLPTLCIAMLHLSQNTMGLDSTESPSKHTWHTASSAFSSSPLPGGTSRPAVGMAHDAGSYLIIRQQGTQAVSTTVHASENRAGTTMYAHKTRLRIPSQSLPPHACVC